MLINVKLLSYLYLLAGQHNQRIDITQLTKPAQIFILLTNQKNLLPNLQKSNPHQKTASSKNAPKKATNDFIKTTCNVNKTRTNSKNQSLVKNITDINQAAQIIRPVIPKYPDIAQKAGIEATVMLEIIVDEQGNVAHCHVLHCSHPGYKFEINAIDAAKN